jgi:hypothetical protein
MGTNFFRSKGFRLLMQKAGQRGRLAWPSLARRVRVPPNHARRLLKKVLRHCVTIMVALHVKLLSCFGLCHACFATGLRRC